MARNTLRRAPGSFGTGRVRIGVEQLEDRTAPALFTVGASQTSTQLNNNGHVVAGFWNTDANLDIVMTNYGPDTSSPGKTITFAYGDGTGKFSGYTSLAVGSGNDHVSFLAAGDLNNDGNQDIVTVQTNTTTEAGTMTVFLGSPLGAFSKTAAGQISTGGARASWEVKQGGGQGLQSEQGMRRGLP